MNRLRKLERVSPDEATLRAWEDMRIEVLHEIEAAAMWRKIGLTRPAIWLR